MHRAAGAFFLECQRLRLVLCRSRLSIQFHCFGDGLSSEGKPAPVAFKGVNCRQLVVSRTCKVHQLPANRA